MCIKMSPELFNFDNAVSLARFAARQKTPDHTDRSGVPVIYNNQYYLAIFS